MVATRKGELQAPAPMPPEQRANADVLYKLFKDLHWPDDVLAAADLELDVQALADEAAASAARRKASVPSPDFVAATLL